MPFSSLETALLYLKPAEIINQDLCGIYELIYKVVTKDLGYSEM